MSMGPAHPLHPSDLGRAQWLAEEVMTWGGLDVLILRVGATFHQNLIALHGDSIRRENLLRNSFGDGQVGWINGSDAGELAVAALLRPATFDGPVCYPTGSELLNHHEIAEILTQELGRPITFEPISPDQWRGAVRVARSRLEVPHRTAAIEAAHQPDAGIAARVRACQSCGAVGNANSR